MKPRTNHDQRSGASLRGASGRPSVPGALQHEAPRTPAGPGASRYDRGDSLMARGRGSVGADRHCPSLPQTGFPSKCRRNRPEAPAMSFRFRAKPVFPFQSCRSRGLPGGRRRRCFAGKRRVCPGSEVRPHSASNRDGTWTPRGPPERRHERAGGGAVRTGSYRCGEQGANRRPPAGGWHGEPITRFASDMRARPAAGHETGERRPCDGPDVALRHTRRAAPRWSRAKRRTFFICPLPAPPRLLTRLDPATRFRRLGQGGIVRLAVFRWHWMPAAPRSGTGA